MILCNMNFLKPEDSEEHKIWLSLNQYTIAIRAAYSVYYNQYANGTSALLESQLIKREPDKNCSNYPLLDEAETDCIWGIHHYTENDVKEIERSVKRAELEYSGKNCTDTTPKHFDEKYHRQLMTNHDIISSNTVKRISDCLIEVYAGYMARRGMAIGDINAILKLIVQRIQASEQTLQHYYAKDPEDYINFAFYQRVGYNNTKKTIVVVSSKSSQLADEIFGIYMKNQKVSDIRIVVVPEEQFYSELATLRKAETRYTVVSKKFNNVMTLLSLFRYSVETETFDEVDPKTFVQTNYVGLYGVEKQEMNTLAVKDVYLLRVPGYSNNYYGVIAELLPLQCHLGEESKVKLLISDKVEVDKFELVDKDGTPISILDGTITWKKLERDVDDSRSVNKLLYGCTCSQKELMQYPDVVSYGVLYELTITTNTDCFINIQCHYNVYTENKPGSTSCFDDSISPKVYVEYKHISSPPVSYDGRESYDANTPGIRTIFIPFCSNIKQVEVIKEWHFGCGELADLMKLYMVYHTDSKNPKLVRKELINSNIEYINIVEGNCIDSAKSVGWFHQTHGKECTIPEHQDNWYLRIELKHPVWVYAPMGVQMHLEKNVIRMTSDRGCSYNVEQDVDFHMIPVQKMLRKMGDCRPIKKADNRYGIMITKSIPNNVIPVIVSDKQPFAITTETKVEKVDGTYYEVSMTFRERGARNIIKVYEYRKGKGTDRIRQYYKKKELLNPPVWFASCSDADYYQSEQDSTVTFRINLDYIDEEIEKYELHFYVPAIVVEVEGNRYLYRNIDSVVDMTK